MMLSRRVAGIPRSNSPTCTSLSLKPLITRPMAPTAAVRARASGPAVRAQQQPEEVLKLRGAETLVLPTIFAKSPDGKELWKANVVLPPSKSGKPYPEEGDSLTVEARGVVLFMHGFAQGPTAYARMLQKLAASGIVVIAPCPPFASTTDKQQGYMVDYALFWRDLIAQNKLPCLKLEGGANENVGLLGHSVGGGLAAYVADAAAKKGQAFKTAQVMAPQTSQVVKEYRYDTANGGSLLAGVDTEWGVQYGLIDLLSIWYTVDKFRAWLGDKGKLRSTVKYELGTHVGFEDQLVVGRESFTTNTLPWVLVVLWGTLSVWLPLLGLRGISKMRGDTNVRAAQTPDEKKKGKEGDIPTSAGFGVPDDVELPDERVMLLGYFTLAATVTAVEQVIPGFAWDSFGDGALSVLKGVFLLLAIGSWPSVVVFPYEAAKQRPEARSQVVQYFNNQLAPAKVKVNVNA